ncbi:unnamed protein product [Vitrella brassicaformis CCMP3155]|uniref:Pre-mRNA-processing factor 19 n=2 Tax=Vitrella brassicaformis TaxID=1169539 RepID=A0A0G4FZ31_VITBC|nr:unnamed protein product [Vitrella brassicaformis CCMP3155]|mmetsp:Transcript_20668/g.50388  ORF Transcript_20668/g.50388 Transcript_20668/m.50388 type:complete len:497 (+) Transcript_20668:170-1660(+)|eukprot:CEM20859.1 unnamed protein product [Vitrella brassicaformis CCMP3155]
MALVCGISGNPPEDPVATKHGCIFERRLIEKHLQNEHTCPVTKEELTVEDLIPIKGNKAVKPRPVTASSIPGMLNLFQTEWDALMTETFQLRMHLDTVRNQLSHSLYQHDAACRVIARLMRERDAARAQVGQLQQQLATARVGAPSDDEEPGVSEAIVHEMEALAKQLKPTRKGRQFPDLTPPDQIKAYTCAGHYPVHSAAPPGILCVDMDESNRIVTGGVDAQVVVFDTAVGKTLAKLHGHQRKVNQVAADPKGSFVLSVSDDKTARLWSASEDEGGLQYKNVHTIRKHKAEVTGLSLHPLRDYFVTCGKDGVWAFHDLRAGRCLKSFEDLNTTLSCLTFHPDGVIMAGGGINGVVSIYGMQQMDVIATLEGESCVTSIAISENGYFLATSAQSGEVKLWDLRKASCFQTIPAEEGRPVNRVMFDHSGQYLAAAGSRLAVHHFESKTSLAPVTTFEDHTADVTDVRFGPDASFLVSTSIDRTVRVWNQRQAPAEG